jgi:mutator protein MutT
LTGAPLTPVIHVAAAVVTDRHRRVLIAQRPGGKHLAGAWEFPGGKLEPGEARAEALARELDEEIGIAIEHPRPLMRLRHTYPYGEVLLDVWVVRRYRGEPRGLDGQALRWCSRADLATADLLPADRPIVGALRLPERLRRVTTPFYEVRRFAHAERGRGAGCSASSPRRLQGALCGNVQEAETAASAGVDFLALSETVADGELAALCERVAMPLFCRGMSLERAWQLGASGINAIEPAA